MLVFLLFVTYAVAVLVILVPPNTERKKESSEQDPNENV